MNWNLIWQTIKEYAISYYNFTLNEGESKFMLVDLNLFDIWDIRLDARIIFIVSYAVMILLAILACDSFKILSPIEGLCEWKKKISFFKIIIFTASVFSFHIFYKSLAKLVGGLINADASLASLNCIGSYINPISVMIYAFAITTMEFRKKNFQALCLGWALFLTPAVLSYSSISREVIVLYIAAGSFGLAGAFLYKKCSPFISYVVLSIVYIIAKAFMIYYSEQMLILTSDSWIGILGQYFACIQVDLILMVILLMILFGYKHITSEKGKVKIKKDLVWVCVFVVCLTAAFICNNTVEIHAEKLEKQEKDLYIKRLADNPIYTSDSNYNNGTANGGTASGQQPTPTLEPEIENNIVLNNDPIIMCVIKVNEGNIRMGAGTSFDVIRQAKKNDSFVGTGNEAPDKKGNIWYEFYLDEEKTETGWASSSIMDKVEIFPIDNLLGIWMGNMKSVLELKEDGICHYKDGSSGEGDGTWSIDEKAVLHVNTSALSYEIYAVLTEGYDTTSIVMKGASSGWRDERFNKQ